MTTAARLVRASRGTSLTCQGWLQEAALRMLTNTLVPEITGRPDDLVLSEGTDRAARGWAAFDATLAAPRASTAATRVPVHHGNGVGIGYSIHSGMAIAANGMREPDERLGRVLTCVPGMGVVQHAETGSTEAMDTAKDCGARMPMASLDVAQGVLSVSRRAEGGR